MFEYGDTVLLEHGHYAELDDNDIKYGKVLAVGDQNSIVEFGNDDFGGSKSFSIRNDYLTKMPTGEVVNPKDEEESYDNKKDDCDFKVEDAVCLYDGMDYISRFINPNSSKLICIISKINEDGKAELLVPDRLGPVAKYSIAFAWVNHLVHVEDVLNMTVGTIMTRYRGIAPQLIQDIDEYMCGKLAFSVGDYVMLSEFISEKGYKFMGKVTNRTYTTKGEFKFTIEVESLTNNSTMTIITEARNLYSEEEIKDMSLADIEVNYGVEYVREIVNELYTLYDKKPSE